MSADSIRDLFSAQVERTPEAIAVTAGATRLTYLELDERSDRLARQLLALGVATDVPVAVLFDISTVAGPAALIDAAQSTAA